MSAGEPVEGADVLVVGAGLSGLVAAERLQAGGAKVVLLDKSVGPGGRLATRRFDGGTFDHGAQFFTIRSSEFDGLVHAWRRDGCPIEIWGHGFAQAPDIVAGPDGAETGGDGHPRYVVGGGMNRLAKHLATGLDVRPSSRAVAITLGAGSGRAARWTVRLEDGAAFVADNLVLTPPVPQSLALLDAGGIRLARDTRSRLDEIVYDPCLAVLVRLEDPPQLPPPGGIQFSGGPVSFLGDNRRKGISDAAALTVHLRGDESRHRYRAADEDIAAEVLGWLRPWLGTMPVNSWQVKRWRYAQPGHLDPTRAVGCTADGARVVFAGDAFGEAKVEGAARSGLTAARSLAG